MQQIIETNWISLLSILIGIVVAYVFFRLQRKGSESASQERKKHATNELLDIVENYIINERSLSEDVIDNFIFASEQDHAVVLRPSCTAISLLRSVALRIQRSQHLDIPHKFDYSEKIEELIRKLLEVEASVATKKRSEDEARKQLAALRMLRLAFITTMIGLMTAVATRLIGIELFNGISSTGLPLTETLLPILFGAFVILVLLLPTVLTIRHIQHRSKKGDEHGPRERKAS